MIHCAEFDNVEIYITTSMSYTIKLFLLKNHSYTFKVYSLAFLVIFSIFMMTELSYDLRCEQSGNTTQTETLNFLDCLRTPYECSLTYFSCHWAETVTCLCIINNLADELRQVSIQ